MHFGLRRYIAAFLPLLSLLALACDSNFPDDTATDQDDNAADADDSTGDDTGTDEGGAAEDWEGRTYLLEVPPDNWIDPPMVGSEIGAFVPLFLFNVTDVTDGELDVRMATASAPDTQDMCNETTMLSGSTASYPAVAIGPGDFRVRIDHEAQELSAMATIYDLKMIDVLPGDDGEAKEGVLTAVMDVRDVYSLFTLLPDPTPDSVCMAIDNFGGACEACPTDDEVYCLSLRAVQLGATEVPDLAVETRSAEDVETDCPDE